jgi:hypothetical protein
MGGSCAGHAFLYLLAGAPCAVDVAAWDCQAIERGAEGRRSKGSRLHPRSGTAKCLVHDLVGPWRIGVTSEGRLILVRLG